jgi:sulfate adenylyltransferase subunit 1 (EFTu-like GTPase family)
LSENPISLVNHSVSFSSFRGVSGTVAQGRIKVDDAIRDTLSIIVNSATEIVTTDGRLRLTQHRSVATDIVHAISG